MPVYEFRCPKCGKSFEVSRPVSKASSGARCPTDGAKARRIFGAQILISGEGGGGFGDNEIGGFGGDDMGSGPMDFGDDF